MSRAALDGRWRRFARDEGGSATIESLIWFIGFFIVLFLIIDTSLAFYGRAQAFRIVQNGNRALSVGRLDSADATENWIRASYAPISNSGAITIDTSIDTVNWVVNTRMTIPVSELVLFGPWLDELGFVTTVQSQHYLEDSAS